MARPIHFEIHAADCARAQAFYAAMFGWTFTKWSGEWDYWLIKTGEDGPGIDGGMIERRGAAPDADADTPVIGYVCTIGVEDLGGCLARAAELGGEVVVPRMAIRGVGWLAYCKDTEGNIFGMLDDDPDAA